METNAPVNLVDGLSNLSSEEFVNSIMEETNVSLPQNETSTPEQIIEDAQKEANAVTDPFTSEPDKAAEAEKVAGETKELTPLDKEINAITEKHNALISNAKTPEEKAKLEADFATEKTSLEEKHKETKGELEIPLPSDAKEVLNLGNEENNGWIELGSEFGIELKSDTPEEFKEKIEEKYKSQYNADISKFAPEAQMFIEFLNNGGTRESFIEPLKPLLEVKQLNDVELIAKEYELQGWPADKIEAKIEDLTENGKIELTAFELRKSLDSLIENVQQDIITKQKNAEERFTNYQTNAKATDVNEIKKELNTVNSLFDLPLTQKHKDYLASKMESGAYDALWNTPAIKAKLILMHELGEAAVKVKMNNLLEKAKLDNKIDKHAIPPIIGGGGTNTSNQNAHAHVDPRGNWAALGDNFVEDYLKSVQ